jgi:hypothetical protein
MVRSRVGIRGVEGPDRAWDPRSNVKSGTKREKLAQQARCAGRDKPEEMRRKKKKGETAVCPQIHPKITLPKWVLLCKVNFKKSYVA